MPSSLWTERYVPELCLNLVPWQVSSIPPLLTAHALVCPEASVPRLESPVSTVSCIQSACLWHLRVLYNKFSPLGVPVQLNLRSLQQELCSDRHCIPRAWETWVLNTRLLNEGTSGWARSTDSWVAFGPGLASIPPCPATGSKPMSWGLEMNYSNSKRTNKR